MNSEYSIAVHALVFLNHKACILSSTELASNICTNPARVRKVMAKLKKAGLVSTKEGLEGGYYFESNPAEVTLFQIGQALGTDFVCASWKSGALDMECLVASGMGKIMDNLYGELNELCLEHLKQRSIADIDRQIFVKSQ